MNLKEQLITDIMTLAMRTQNETGRCVFVQFSGHVNMLDISIRRSRAEYTDELARKELRLEPFQVEDPVRFEQTLIDDLMNIRDILKTTIEEKSDSHEPLLRLAE